jgi:predicted ester cyclase
VARYFEETRTAFPDQRNELIALHHADDAVLMEAMLYGTHLGSFRGLPATGRSFEMRFLSMFPLTLRGRLATVANHPLTVGRALVRRVAGR